MLKAIGINSTSQILAAATTIAALGFLPVIPSAQANPLAPIPLAPACDQYVFNGRFEVRGTPLDLGRSGWRVFFNATGQSAGTPPAAVVFDDGGQLKGHVVAGGIQGRSINFRIKWDDKPDNFWSFWGTVVDDGFAHGTEEGPGSGAPWSSQTPLSCATPAPQQPAPPQKKMATVTGDVDVYNIAADDVPEADGVVGEKIGMLRAGQQVELGGPCNPNDWCKVLSSELPGGNGFVWGHLQF
jgi:hypothetical protein